jgi:KUP system potassium uptake protein
VAETGTMLMTTILVSAVMLLMWKWPPVLAVSVLLGFLLVDGLFFAANVPKIFQGGFRSDHSSATLVLPWRFSIASTRR